MNLTNSERASLIVLSTLLLIGSMILHLNKEANHKKISVFPTQEKIKIDINTADINELANLPGVGETLALRIIAYRTNHAKFSSENDLLKIEGIGNKKLSKLKDYIQV